MDSCRTARVLLLLPALLLPAPTPAADPADGSVPGDAPPEQRYENTLAKDFMMDAPWRVIDANTPIPVTVILKDCDVDDIRDLHWIRCWDVTGGGSTILWDHDFGDETIGNDSWEQNFWTYIVSVTEGHPSLPNGTLLTPANLGYATGDAIQLKVSVYYRDDWFNYTESRWLRVHVGSGPFPWPAGWYGGDTHYHTMYTNNIAEFGAPIPAVSETGIAMGLQWLTVTDHSCDLDELGDGPYSYGTPAWEYTVQDASGISTTYRDNSGYSNMWDAAKADVALLDAPDFRLFTGVELNVGSIDPSSYDKTLHFLVYNPAYISSPNSGALGERPVSISLTGALSAISGTGFGYAAHPLSDLSAEWGGIDWGMNGAPWGSVDITTALGYDAFRGFQAFNQRELWESTDQYNPWPDFDAGSSTGNPYPGPLLAGITLWDTHLRAKLGTARPQVFFSGGSDAHGDFNFASHLGIDDYATDNAMGKVQTVVHVPGGYSSGNLPPSADLLEALRLGRSVVTDGPFLEIGIDRDGNGSWYDTGDLMIGDDAVVNPSTLPDLSIRWGSLAEFGSITSLSVLVGDASGTSVVYSFDPSSSGQGLGGSTTRSLSALGLTGDVYLRAECVTTDGVAGHRAYTNPIWLTMDAMTGVPELPGAVRPMLLPAAPNPFRPGTTLTFLLERAAPVRLDILDPAGRRVRVLVESPSTGPGSHRVVWDGRDAHGRTVPAGVYLARLVADGIPTTRKLVLIR
ncbi:MAG: FlgD immunoglobulin-like domain containing protein [Gemmatimonadota bacterium]|jgi:hypothetical protein|nr:FlgD immunoglobulin-like domain containing protein [Gemmatimonadota bacterium]MDP6803598.1 FlgD immunoglobulin-like domain containing protein [Gemmatimonadota bacterium]MDP7032570.1 FlgD immunoglobulin-like domain containing protein [Gemmatimonadota bacterium]